MLKRSFDFAAASVGLLVLCVPMLLLAIVVRATSPGPAIFSQMRVGRGGQLFSCHKLRTMRQDAPVVPTHEAPASAVTGFGRFLRRTKLDELPQLYDVLVGNMSFVGPRPCLPTQTELVRLRRENGVLAVRPGITGLAQIHGIDMSDPVRLAEVDATYVRSATFFGDLRILIATVFGGSGQGDRIRG